jgi:hypothetical protein
VVKKGSGCAGEYLVNSHSVKDFVAESIWKTRLCPVTYARGSRGTTTGAV